MIVFSAITCLSTFKSHGKTKLCTTNPPEDDDPRLESGRDPWNFAAQIDWEGIEKENKYGNVMKFLSALTVCGRYKKSFREIIYCVTL
ncbi:hypothetical protein CEXT_617101 [Caerostris extrusa]|uniref:Uncharacterized protein n=1 Tax=Caerostris extrusa TaxID=172846 RepID=A0AAV4XSN7_CAEEX|nr:hypothetical protein CEXT_617101 [Caerostris extrusa]